MAYKLTIGQVIGIIAVILTFCALSIYHDIASFLIEELRKELAFFIDHKDEYMRTYQLTEIDIQLIMLEIKDEIRYIESYSSSASGSISLLFIAWLIPWFTIRKILTFPIGWIFFYAQCFNYE